MSIFLHRIEALIDGELLGWWLAAAMAATCLGCLWALHGARARSAVMATLGSAALTFVLGVVRVERDRAKLGELVLGTPQGDPSRRARLIAEAANRIYYTLVLTPPVLTLVMGLLVCVLVRKRAITPGRTVAIAAAILVGLSMTEVWWTFDHSQCGFHCSSEARYEEVANIAQALRTGRFAVAAVACLIWVFALVRWRREVMHAATPLLARAGTALLGLGLFAFVAARGMRWDSWHLMPFDAPNVGACYASADHEAELPLASPDCVAQDAPLLDFSLDAASIDGELLTRPEEVTELLQRKADLWRQINPGQSFPGTFMVQAPGRARPTELLPWLSAAQHAGFSRLAVYMRAPLITLSTKTLGTLHKQRCCVRTIALSNSAAIALSRYPTWSDVARATHATELTVSLH